jgi:hypothetical protein
MNLPSRSAATTVLCIALCGAAAAAATHSGFHSGPQLVPVYGRAQPFALNIPVSGGVVTVDGDESVSATTDAQGGFVLQLPVGENVTLTLTHNATRTTQSGTFTVPVGGVPEGPATEISLQAPYTITYDVLSLILLDVGKPDPSQCHFVVTVTAFNKTLRDLPQGEPDAVATLYTANGTVADVQDPYYFGVFANNDTDPFTRGLTATSLDGGVLWFNVPLAPLPYVVRVSKPGFTFSESWMWCHTADRFVNAAPTQGPRVLRPPS